MLEHIFRLGPGTLSALAEIQRGWVSSAMGAPPLEHREPCHLESLKGRRVGLSCHSQAAPDILTEQKTEPSPGSHIPTRVLLLLLWGRGYITF